MEPIVTLTTDWGDHDYFLGAVKGTLYSHLPSVRVVDLSHSQEWNDPFAVANMVRYACLTFPKGTIHIIDVGSNDDKNKPLAFVATCFCGHYIICSDVSILELALTPEFDTVYRLPLPSANAAPFCTFLALTVGCHTAIRLAKGEVLSQMGEAIPDFRLKGRFMGRVDNNTLQAMVTTVDKYGNALLNVRYDEFCQICGDRKFRVEVSSYYTPSDSADAVTTINHHYREVRRGALLLTVSATGFLQLAINKGSARRLLGLKPTSTCLFRFY